MRGNRRRSEWLGRFAGWLFLAAGAGAGSLPQSLLPADPAAWIPAPDGGGAPPAQACADGQTFECPFPAGAERQVWDCKTKLDLRAAHGFEFAYSLENPDAFRAITWYVRSGADWYAAALPACEGRRYAWVPLTAFEPLGKPAGWKRVNGFRLSPWSAARGPGRLTLHRVQASQARIAIVRPDLSIVQPGEQAYGESIAEGIGAQLVQMAAPYVPLRDSNLADTDLRSFQAIILPYNPQPPPRELQALRGFLNRGGKLMVFYNANPELARLMDVQPGRYLAANRPGRWQAIAFDPAVWSGPWMVHQTATDNIYTATPASDQAKVLAWWADAEGTRQPEAAWIVSDRGAWMTHVLTAEDDAPKRRMLATLMDRMVPGLFGRAAEEAVAAAENRAGAPFETALSRWAALGLASNELGHLQALDGEARAALAEDQFAKAWDAADRLSATMDRMAGALYPLPSAGFRGIWDHSGQGLYAGNWKRTAREIAEAGLRDVFAFVPRGAVVEEQTIQNCAQQGLRVHAWHICWNIEGSAPERIRELETAGRLQRSDSGQIKPWLCPSQRENREAELALLSRLAQTPGLAGLHVDYIRYPDERHCFCPACRQAFAEAEGVNPDPWPASVVSGEWAARYRAWRARQISQLVEDVSNRVRREQPGLKLSAAVFPDYPACVARLGQDWGAWLGQGWVDFVCPMNYTGRSGEMADWTAAQAALPGAKGRIMAGIGVTSSLSRLTPIQTLRQIQAAMSAGAAGFVLFDLTHTIRRELFPALRMAASPPADRE